MSEDNRVAEFVARNKAFAANHKPQPLIDGPGGLRENLVPFSTIVIISCIDVRVMREAFFGLQQGEAAVLSNAGGRVNADALRSIYVLNSLAGVGTVVVVHHTGNGKPTHTVPSSLPTSTFVPAGGIAEKLNRVARRIDCGLTHTTDDDIRMKLKERAGPEKEREVDAMEFMAFKDMKQSILDDMDTVKASPYLKKDLKVFGFLFDIIKGTITDVKDM